MAAVHGILFEQKLRIHVLLHAFNRPEYGQFEFAQEYVHGGKFDDIVFRYNPSLSSATSTPTVTVYMQLKHRENDSSEISRKELMENDGSLFYLPSHFINVMKLLEKIPNDKRNDVEFIICTNAKFKGTIEEWKLIDSTYCPFPGANFYQCSPSDKTIEEFHKIPEKIERSKKLKEIGKELVKHLQEDNSSLYYFFQRLRIAVVESGSNLDKLISDGLRQFARTDHISVVTVVDSLRTKMYDMLDSGKERNFFTREHWKKVFLEVIGECSKDVVDGHTRDHVRTFLHHLDHLKFVPDHTWTTLEKCIGNASFINIICKQRTTDVTELKLYKWLQSTNRKFIFLTTSTVQNEYQLVENAFKTDSCELLVLVNDSVEGEDVCRKMSSLAASIQKDIIIISHTSIDLDDVNTLKRVLIDDINNLINVLLNDSKGKLIYRGCEIDLQSIDESFKKLVVDEVLIRLACGECVRIGKELPQLRRSILYMDRKLRLQTTETSSKVIPKLVSKVSDVSESLVLLASQAGMGKSTFFKKIAINTASSKAGYCVILIELGIKTKILKFIHDRGVQMDATEAVRLLLLLANLKIFNEMSSEQLEQMLECVNVDTNNKIVLSHSLDLDLEAKIFAHFFNTGRLILMVDAYDEICSKYTDEVTNWLVRMKTFNLKALWISTRSYNVHQRLEMELSAKSFSLFPFDANTQRKFFTLHLKEQNRCFNKKYFNKLLEFVQTSNRDFLSIPLHCAMVVEVFRHRFTGMYDEHAVFRDEDRFLMKETLSLCSLYDHFIETKFTEIAINEKGNLDTSKASSDRILKAFRKEVFHTHKQLAIQSLFPQELLDSLGLDSDEMQVAIQTIKVGEEFEGFVEYVEDTRPRFVHKTYAEYFAALWIVEEVRNKNAAVLTYYRSITFDDDSKVIRQFVDGELTRQHLLCRRIIDGNVTLDFLDTANELDPLNRTALMFACVYNASVIFRFLLKKTNDVDAVDTIGFTALQYAIRKERWEMADEILQRKPRDTAFISEVPHERILRESLLEGHRTLLTTFLCEFKPSDSVMNSVIELLSLASWKRTGCLSPVLEFVEGNLDERSADLLLSTKNFALNALVLDGTALACKLIDCVERFSDELVLKVLSSTDDGGASMLHLAGSRFFDDRVTARILRALCRLPSENALSVLAKTDKAGRSCLHVALPELACSCSTCVQCLTDMLRDQDKTVRYYAQNFTLDVQECCLRLGTDDRELAKVLSLALSFIANTENSDAVRHLRMETIQRELVEYLHINIIADVNFNEVCSRVASLFCCNLKHVETVMIFLRGRFSEEEVQSILGIADEHNETVLEAVRNKLDMQWWPNVQTREFLLNLIE